jgi:hypothetical protein
MHKQARTRLSAIAGATFATFILASVPATAQSFTDWGWPQPYEKGLRQIHRLA